MRILDNDISIKLTIILFICILYAKVLGNKVIRHEYTLFTDRLRR